MAVFGLSRLTGLGCFFFFFRCFEQVHPQENIHAKMDDGREVKLEGYLPATSRAINQQFSAVP